MTAVAVDDHILAVSLGPPWVEPRFPPRLTPRTARLHDGPYDQCAVDVYSLGQILAVGGVHGRVVYEHKEHDESTATYVAVGEGWAPVDRHEATTAGRTEGRGLTGSSRAEAERSAQPTSAAPSGVPALTPDLPDEGALF